MSISKKPRLGRGLSSLINTPVKIDPPAEEAQNPASSAPAAPVAKPQAGQGGSAADQAQSAANKKSNATPAAVPPPSQSAANPTPIAAPATTTKTAAASTAQTTQAATSKAGEQANEHRSLKVPAEHDPAAPRLIYLPIDSIVANPYQPRQQFDQSALDELAASIRQAGLMQPILVRHASQKTISDYQNTLHSESTSGITGQTAAETSKDQGKAASPSGQSVNTVHSPGAPGVGSAPQSIQLYELVAGERRWRAARLAGLKVIPAVLHQLGDQQLAEWAVIENLQRENLNPVDQAQAFRRLTSEFGLTHAQLADRLGIGRVKITNTLRLLELEDFILAALRQGQLTAGHGRALLAIPDSDLRMNLGRRAIHGDWSVRTLETTARRLTGVEATDEAGQGAASVGGGISPRQAHMKDLESQIGQQLQTRVRLRTGKKKGAGAITIEFFTIDQFDQLLERLQIRLT